MRGFCLSVGLFLVITSHHAAALSFGFFFSLLSLLALMLLRCSGSFAVGRVGWADGLADTPIPNWLLEKGRDHRAEFFFFFFLNFISPRYWTGKQRQD